MNTIDFFLKYKGKFIDSDNAYGSQCVDLIKAYFKEVLNLVPIQGNAIDYWKDLPGFIRFENKGLQWPKPGDIVIWNTGYNPYGHIAIVNWVRTFDIGVFEQNNPVGSPCRYWIHSYKNILGWLRPSVKKTEFSVTLVNPSLFSGTYFKERLNFYAGGKPSFIYKEVSKEISVPNGTFTGDQAMKLIDTLGKSDIYLIFYPSNPTSTFEVASYYPTRNCAFATIPSPVPTTIPVHAMLHCLRKYINFNKLGPYIEDVEKYPSQWSDMANFENEGWKFTEQYNQLKTYF